MRHHHWTGFKGRVVASLAIVVACGSYALIKRGSHSDTAASLQDPAMAAIRMNEPSGRFGRSWTKGKDQGYELDLNSVVTTQSQPFVHVGLHGPLHVVALQTEPTLLLAVRYEGALA